jgi:bacteriocin biosynthesis cyclodehydratase domain-containing protein
VLAELLRALQDAATVAELQARAGEHGVADAVVTDLIDHLIATSVVREAIAPATRAAVVRLHGSGPLTELLTAALRGANVRVTTTSRTHASSATADLAVLTDFLVADPRVVRDLHDDGVPHLPVRMRDGTGLVGPLVVPGITSCLRCADLHRSDRDAAWPAIASQLCRTVGTADRATALATAGLALREIDHVLQAVRGGTLAGRTAAPPTMDTTLEFDVTTGSVTARRWSRHPQCRC